ncbi:hypothetical protein TVAG_289850 [Trichomonas vaginalis G3]|uniref:Bap-like n=1 Tax=Trichomonas vaginalis (strain ATCC PRA-98 / G3) TaxID=412133 RepID=A2GBT6_TRIV3|nr:bifunctional inhibitor/lipid-transfer protein/seed storage 2s albumin superfamily protein family [Trichomonas vaginalis G3]EAX85381.1 hypothetical protein TVAG_289850 [Trichomonas vaginalis G3]KAI5550365.1 bifunctional inhibitor/lipid-transfer protein/seed storage 2s albumin superfamily protein family [Trichomonas vaginalis G3]|eukprot:XP_001298311.1 hypothetical protein [Trichomonas vaginalis G3]
MEVRSATVHDLCILTLKTVIGAGRITRPVVSFTSTFAESYTMNQEIEVSFEVTNIVANQKIAYYIESTNNQIIKDEFIATTTSKKITQKVTVRSSPEFNITIYCKRGNYEVSIPITKILNVPRSPSLHFDEKPKNSYTKNSRIAVKGRIIDVSTGLLAYKFDSTETKVLPKEYTVSNSYYFSELIDFPVNFQDGQHCITFYAVDKASNTYSKGDEFEFSFVNTHPPEIQNLKTSAETVIRGRTVKVTGQIKDEDPNSYSDISLSFGEFGPETTIIPNFETKITWTDFEYELTIPPDTPPGKYRISVSAKDTGRDQSEYYYCYVTVLIQPITPFQTAPKTAFETPFNTAFQTSHNTPYETPFSSAFQTAHDTPFVTVFATPFLTSQETPIKEVPPANGESPNEKSNLDDDSKNSSSVTPNSADEMPTLFQDDGSAKKKKSTILIVVICSVIAVIIIAILIAVFIYKRTHQDDSEEESSIEMAETVIQSVVNPNDGATLDNPLFTTTTVDDDEDIFAGDFEEGNTVHYFFIKEEDE